MDDFSHRSRADPAAVQIRPAAATSNVAKISRSHD
jgi:hypothetical protein